MIAVISTGPLTGRAKAIYDRILRYTPNPEQYQHFQSGEGLPENIKTVILLDDWDSYLTKTWLGRYIPIQKARGYRHKVGDRIVIPTYSPHILNGRMNYIPVAIWDFKLALKTDGQPPPEFPLEDLVLHPSVQEFERFCIDEAMMSGFPVAVDLETPGKKEDDDVDQDLATTIVRASFAYLKDGKIKAVTFPWIEPYIHIFKTAILLNKKVETLFWNGWLFDIPVLRENNINPQGRIIDAMWLYKFLQPTLPKSLGAVTTLYAEVPEWKSLNNDQPELYSAMDAWATLKDYLGIKAALEKRGVWSLADRHVTDLLKLLDEMHLKGVAVSPKALEEFNTECDTNLACLQEQLNEHPDLKPLRGWHPKQGYKKTPKDTTGLERKVFDLGTITDEYGNTHTDLAERWARREDFLPTSKPQVESYFDSKGYTYDNTDEKTLTKLAQKHKDDLLYQFIAYRELVKSKGTYGGIPVGSDGRVHTTFTLRPDTHRLSSIKPNLQNLSSEFKHVFVPSLGCKLVEVDLSSVEAVLTGFFADDAEYIRRAKIGIHKIAMAVFLGIPIDFSKSDAEIKAIVKDIKDRDEKLYRNIKVVIYGGNYLAGARTVYRNNPTDFSSEKEAKKFIQFCQSLSPKIPAWQRRTVEQAQRQHGLTNPFGYYKALWSHEDGPAACAFLPQSTVAAIMKEIMLDLCPELRSYLVLQVHDSLVFDIPESRIEAMTTLIKEAFSRSWPELNNLEIGFEMKIGDSLHM